MKKIFAAIAAVAGLAAAPAAQATVEYRFNVLDIRCDDPNASCQLEAWKPALNSLSISLYDTPAFIRTESQRYGIPGGEENVYSAENFHAASFGEFRTEVDPARKACVSNYRCGAYGEFDVAFSYLAGSLNIFSEYSDMWMSSGPDRLWRGYLLADGGLGFPGEYPVFTGMWLAVPEPSPVVLIGAGLAALIWVRRRKDTREQA